MGLPLREPIHLREDVPISIKVDSSTGSLKSLVSDRPCGALDTKALQILNGMKDNIETQIFADRQVYNGTSWEPRQSKHAKGHNLSLTIHVVLYGCSSLFEHVGSFLTECGIYLQHPVNCDRNVPYKNPQCLTMATRDLINTYDLDDLSRPLPRIESDFFSNPIALLASGSELPLVEAPEPAAIKTPLYRHQKQALAFMKRREQGWNFQGLNQDIWRSEINAFGRPSYVNHVSGTKRSKPPPEMRGGILSDAPGLGKGLSIIALIAAGKQPQLSESDVPCASTTLLVVPKTRES